MKNSMNESRHTEYFKNDYYEFLPLQASYVECQLLLWVEWTDVEIDLIWKFIQKQFNQSFNREAFEVLPNKSRQVFISITLHRYSLEIRKLPDEWYILKPRPNYGTVMNRATENWIYKCDQLDGLIKLLEEEFIKKVIV